MKTSFQEKREIIAEIDKNILLADGFESALLGYVEIFNKIVALYDREKCINILIKRDKMAYEDAVEFFDYNVTGAYVGEYTPAFATFI